MCESSAEEDLGKIFMHLSSTVLARDILHKTTSAVRPTARTGTAAVLPHHGRDGLSQYGPSRARTGLPKSRPDGVDGRPDRTMQNTETAWKQHFRPLRQYIKVGSPGNTADRSQDTQPQLPLIAGVLRTRPVERFDVILVSP